MTKFNIKKLVKPTINKIAKYIPGEAKDNEGEKYIKLSSNESPFKIPERIFSSLNKIILNSNVYPDGDSQKLKDSIARRFKLKKNK